MTLSPQQRRVVELVGRGMSDKAIAREMGLGYASVKTHLRAAFRKLGVRNRTGAAMALLNEGAHA